jgi:hypothetical protein
MRAIPSLHACSTGRYSMQHNRRRRTILRLFATLLKMGDEINPFLWISSSAGSATVQPKPTWWMPAHVLSGKPLR